VPHERTVLTLRENFDNKVAKERYHVENEFMRFFRQSLEKAIWW